MMTFKFLHVDNGVHIPSKSVKTTDRKGIDSMPLTVKDQVNVLYDLLSEHSEDCCGSVSECQQIQRLVRSILTKKELQDENVLRSLPAIYDYGKAGEDSGDLTGHITSNQSQLEEWVTSIGNVKY